MTELLLAILLHLVPAKAQEHRGESVDHARDRYATIGSAIASEASGDRRLISFLVAVARHESSFARDVHSGKKRGDAGRSYGLFQLQLPPAAAHDPYHKIPNHPKGWRGKDIVGTDEESTHRAVWTAAWLLRPKIRGCKGAPECVFRSYGGVPPGEMKPTVAKRIRARVRTYQRVRQKLSQE